MAIYEDIILRLDERAAKAVSDEIANAGRDGSQAFERHFTSGNLRSTMQKVGREAGDALHSGLRNGVSEALMNLTGQFGTFGKTAGSVLDAMPVKAAAAAVGIGAIALGAVEAGKALYNLGKQWDDIADSITVKTGKTGEDLENLTKIVGDVGSTTAASLGSIGTIVEQISQSMPDLAQNNAAVRQMASNLAYLDANGQSVNVRQLGMAFSAFNVSASEQVRALDDLNRAAQATGIPINELISTVRAGAPQFRQFGLDMGQATGMLASFTQAGVAPQIAVTGLRIALKNVGGEGKDAAANLASAVTQIKALHDAQNEGAAQQKAQDVFGTKNAAAFLQVIENGTLSVENLNKALSDSGLSVAEQQGATDDWAQSLEKIKNTVSVGLKPLADTVFGSINAQLQAMAGNLGFADDKAKALADSMRDAASVPITADSALGRMLTPGGLAGSSTPGVATPGGVGNAIGGGGPGAGLTLPGGLLAPQWGSHAVSPSASSSSGSGGSTPAAQVPYGALPGISPGVPLTPEVYSAQTSLWEANHNVEEKRARVAQLEADNTAKAEDLVAARNDAAKAERDQLEAQMRFAQTQQNAYEKQFKQLTKASDQLGDIGAQLDSDFGISKGLAGIVENITKAVANLAAAPVIGALAGGQMGLGFKPGEAGSGLMGILAGSGAFGPQYQLPPAWARGDASQQGGYSPSVIGPAAAGGYPGDAALLANAPRGIGRYDNATKDLSRGLVDCASGVEDLVNILDGKSTAGGSLWTGNASSVLPQMGFRPGMGGPGDFRIGYRNGGPGGGHLQATLPGGANVNFGSTAAIQAGGLDGSLGAYDPSFTDHYYRPVTGGGGGGGGWGGSAPSASAVGGGEYAPLGPGQLTDPGLTNPTVAGSPGQGYPLPWNLGGPGGAGMPSAPGAVGASAGGPTLIGGLAPKQGSGKGGISMSGGILGAALSGASSAAGLAASGAAMGMDGGMGGAAASAAMQIGIQEINRAIQFGSQAAGIGVAGLMETFLPTGASELAQNNWLTKIVGGIAGAGVTLPNTAGGGKKTPEGLTPEQAAQYENGQPPGSLTPEQAANAHRGGAGQTPGPGNTVNNNVTVNNQRATEDGTGRDLTYHLGQMAAAPGM